MIAFINPKNDTHGASFTQAFMTENGRKPSQSEFNRREELIKKAKSKLDTMTLSTMLPEYEAHRDWRNPAHTMDTRATWLQAIVQYSHSDSEEVNEYWESMRKCAQQDVDARNAISFLNGYIQAMDTCARKGIEPRDLSKSTHANKMAARGWNRARRGKPQLPHKELVRFLATKDYSVLT